MPDEISQTEKCLHSRNVQPDVKDSRSLPPRSPLASRQVAVRLGLAFSILVALLIAVGDLGLRRMDRINADLQDITGKQWAKVRLSRDTESSSNRNSRITMQIFLLKDREQIDTLLATRVETSKRTSALLAELENLCKSEEEKRQLAVIKDARRSYMDSYLRALHLLVDENKRNAAIAVMVQETTPLLFKYNAAWNEFVRFQGDQLELAARQSSVRYAATRRLALFVIVVAVMVQSAIALFAIGRMVQEITARLRDEKEAIRTAHQEAEVFINAVPSILIGMDHDSRITRWNSAAAGAFGLSGIEVLGKQLTECGVQWLRPDMPDEIRSWCSERRSRRCDQVPFERNGETRLLGLTITPVRMVNGNPTELLVIGSDITTRKKNEAALLEAERKYHGIFDEAIIGIFQNAPHGRFLSVNPAMARIFGYDSPEEMVAGVTQISQLYVEPKRYHEFVMVMDRLGSMLSLECEVFRKDGSKIWIASSGRAVRENRVVVRYEGMAEDITQRKLLQNQLFQAQKLESIGQLAAGIAHEINTPTQYIGDNVRFLKDAFLDLKSLVANYERLLLAAKGNTLSCETVQEIAAAVERADAGYLLEEIPKAIDQTLEGVTRVSTLVGAMKEFSHPGTKERTSLDLNHAIQCTITVARNEWKYVADMGTDFDPSLPLTSCQPGEFNQVILNLIVNAAHTIADVVGKGGSEKGKIKMQTRNCPEWVEIRVQDTGKGIPEKVRARIFDPFFTTKEIGKGTGQGLAIARSVIVDKHGGTIHFETEEGKGTTFIIRLPKEGNALAAGSVSA
ncbi:MAG: PAS domain S-box protein [Terriglobales bacterium]|jgi:PAS domain S-box-containing protein